MTYKIKQPKAKEQKDKFYQYRNYKNVNELQRYIRKNGARDYFKLNGIVYTQEEYDLEGHRILYSNKRTNTGFIVTTRDRYKEGFGDAEIEYVDEWNFFRDDMSYID
jgi:hypothetical protein